MKPVVSTAELPEMPRQIRRDLMKMLLISKSGHSGGPLGLADIFASLYFHVMNVDPQRPAMPELDYFFLSAGHLCPVWYATLARRGFIPIDELETLSGRSTAACRATRRRPTRTASPASKPPRARSDRASRSRSGPRSDSASTGNHPRASGQLYSKRTGLSRICLDPKSRYRKSGRS